MDDRIPKTVAESHLKDCLALRLRYINRIVTAMYDDALRTLGVTINQINILAAIANLGHATSSHLTDQLRMDASTLSRNLDRMAKRGWIVRNEGRSKRRQVWRMNDSGTRLLMDAEPLWKEVQKQCRGIMGMDGVVAIHLIYNTLSTPEDLDF